MFQNLQSIEALDKNHTEIISIIRNLTTSNITSDNVNLLLKLALRIILLDDNSSSVSFCWTILKGIESLKLPIEEYISLDTVYEILNEDIVCDCPEALKIVSWILKNTHSIEFKMAVKQKVIEMVAPKKGTGNQTLDKLEMIIDLLETLRTQPNIMLQDADLLTICKNLVLSLGEFELPKDPQEINVFFKNVEEISNFLIMVNKNPKKPKEFQYTLINALYTCITNPEKEAGPGLATVLQMIDPDFVKNVVQWILVPQGDDAKLARALSTLCLWISQWPRGPNLSQWVIAFMKGLQIKEKYTVLEQVSMEKIKNICKLLPLSVCRLSASQVLFYMLASIQHKPDAFLLAANEFPTVINALRREDSESSRDCLQLIVDYSSALMELFPERNSVYTQLRIAIGGHQPSHDYQKYLNVPVWSKKLLLLIPPIPNVPGKVGLINLGNTCYMNSVLQAIFMTQAFKNDLLLSQCNTGPFLGLQTLFALLQFSTREALSPPEQVLMIRPPGFAPGLQHDSSEFMGYLLDVMHEHEKTQIASRYPCSSGAAASVPTLIQKTFGGQAEITYRCESCGSESIQSDSFRDLQLSFPTNSRDANNSVQTLLDYYMEPEQLCGENQYWCERCAALTDAERVFRVLQVPRHLILTLKHFRYDPKSQQRAKLFQRVSYDLVIELNDCQYELYAAVVHAGASVDSGHYFTFARDSLGVWYEFNDSHVSRSSLSNELSNLQQPCTPYILFYRRQDINTPHVLTVTDLPANLQTVVMRDTTSHAAEKRKTAPIILNHSNSNDDQPPPGCGGGDFNASNTSNVVF